MRNYYAVLALPQNASREEVRARFRELARERHPDRFQGDEKDRAEREFQDITEAFNVLYDPARRRQHDLALARPGLAREGDKEQVARVYLQRGVKAYRDKNFLAAAESFRRAAESEPENALAWHHLALACSHQRRWQPQALEAIERACSLAPMNPTYLKIAGRLHAAAGHAARAAKFYDDALVWGGEDPEVRSELEALKGGRKGRGGLFGKAGG